MPSRLLLCAMSMAVAASAAAGEMAADPPAGGVDCIAPAEPASADLAHALCAAVVDAVRGRLASLHPAPLLVEVLAQRRDGFDARLGWRGPAAAEWGPVLSSSSLDTRGIAPGAVESLAAALLKVTPVPAAILAPVR